MPPPQPKGIPAPPALPKDAVPPLAAPVEEEPQKWQMIKNPFDPEEVKKEEMQNDADFSKYLKAVKMGVTPHQIRMKIRQEGKFDPDDLLLFLDQD